METKSLKYLNCIKSLAFFGLIIIAFILQGCKKEWLEAKVDKKQAVPETVKDFQAMLDYVSAFNLGTTVGFNEIAADGHYYTESNYNSMASGDNQFHNIYTWSINTPFNGGVSSYSGRYSGILNANIILNEAEKSDDKDKDGLAQVKAQAFFHRGRIFFELAQDFAKQYDPSTASSDLGLALRLSTDITEPSKRSTLKQTYDQIISDLKSAKDVLPNIPAFNTRASKLGALGMLAKTYLIMGDYTNAFNYANEYLNIKSDLIEYSNIPTSSAIIGLNKEVTFITILSTTPSLTSYYKVDQSLFDSYDNNDLRKLLFFRTSSAGIAFKGNYSSSLTHNFAGIATDEIYLIRAECYARLGNIALAMKDLNDLLKTRWAKNSDGTTKYVNQIAVDETDALKKIFIERKKELILRNIRWSDLRRLNLDDRFKVSLSRTIGGKTYTLEPNSYKYTFPIPDNVIRLSGMQQNPGY
jgi:tetratricopeptide (TPR) repeat protein